ncbi:MAG: carboxylating nicotinate-nucleotide diphosphorylase [archaeon]
MAHDKLDKPEIQTRSGRIRAFWNREDRLALDDAEYRAFAQRFLSYLLRADIGKGDATNAALGLFGLPRKVAVIAGQDGVLAGMAEAGFLLQGISAEVMKKDGDPLADGQTVLELTGPPDLLLSVERSLLNLLQRMSGIATETARYAKSAGTTPIMATRKTHWGSLDKRAVVLGGGLSHRLGLDDGVLIKENHLRVSGLSAAQATIAAAREGSTDVEVEVETEEEALSVAQAVAEHRGDTHFAMMLDNMDPETINSVISMLKKKDLLKHILIEASGGITFDTIPSFAATGVDALSIGAITHSAPAFDFSLEVIP